MDKIIGREHEKALLERNLSSKEAEFIAVYGRRRVGKTYLVSEFCKDKGLYFEATGQLNAKKSIQLENFSIALAQVFYHGIEIAPPYTWPEAFRMLKEAILKTKSKRKIILFIDEAPWFAFKNSGFLSALEYFWNTWASRQKNIKLIACGSASSWMLRNIVNSKEGLHNRITATIRLLPFTLSETKMFLEYRGVKLNDRQILDIYMVMGGIPYYLRHLQKGMSSVQNINNLCFCKDGVLVDEFNKLYDSLFTNSANYKTIVTALAKSRKGLPRKDLAKKLAVKTGGTINRILENLREAGFIAPFPSYGKKNRGARYRLIDEYSYFYLHWIRGLDSSILNDPGSQYWQTMSGSQRWKSWSGYTFETVCFKHVRFIKVALGISGVITKEASWQYIPEKGDRSEKGGQIDLLLDRNDNVISICEIKCHSSEFSIDKKYAQELKNKIGVFREKTTTNKSIFLVMVTVEGVKANSYSTEIVNNEVTLKDFFV